MSVTSVPVSSTARAILCGVATAVMAELRRRDHESLVDEDLRPDRMVDGHQREMIVVIDLP